MSTQKTYCLCYGRRLKVHSDVHLPKVQDHFIAVATKAVALNPADWEMVEDHPSKGAIGGYGYSGVVEEMGNCVKGLKVGDGVAGFAQGGTFKSLGTIATRLTRFGRRSIPHQRRICRAHQIQAGLSRKPLKTSSGKRHLRQALASLLLDKVYIKCSACLSRPQRSHHLR